MTRAVSQSYYLAWNFLDKTNRCYPAGCFTWAFPRMEFFQRYAKPCYSPNGDYINETDISVTVHPDVQRLVEQNHTLVVFVAPIPDHPNCLGGNLLRLAFTPVCNRDVATRRPMHGMVVWCINISNPPPRVDMDTLRNLAYHEPLHLLLPNNWYHGNPNYNCDTMETCKFSSIRFSACRH